MRDVFINRPGIKVSVEPALGGANIFYNTVPVFFIADCGSISPHKLKEREIEELSYLGVALEETRGNSVYMWKEPV